MNYYNLLYNKIKLKKACIGIVGLGYVGLPLAKEFLKANFKVIGFDIDKNKVNKLKKNETYIEYINFINIKKKFSNNFIAKSIFNEIVKTDVIILCLPTPLAKNKDPDLKYIKSSILSMKKFLRKGQILILESTTYPGTTRDYLLPLIKDRDFVIGKDFFISYSPERQDPGNKKFNLYATPKIVSGLSKNCLNIANLLYKNIVKETVRVASLEIAEITKLYENIYRSINIGLANEMKLLCDKMNLDIYEIIEAAKTKPFGFHAFYPGPGLGGHCIPIDPFYLSWKAKQYNFDMKFIKLSAKINNIMPNYVVSKVEKKLKTLKIKISNSKILIIGVSYKKNVDDLRESPAIKIIDILKSKLCKVNFYDPYVKKISKSREHNIELKSIFLSEKSISKFHIVVVVTDHDNLPYKMIEDNARILVDCRNRFGVKSSKIIKA